MKKKMMDSTRKSIAPAFQQGGITLYHGLAQEILPGIASGSVDTIINDPPYGVTSAEFDVPLEMEKMWNEYGRLIGDHSPVVLFSQQPFSTDLINSNRKWFRYEIVWDKQMVTGHLNAKHMPMRRHENILVFSKKRAYFDPQMTAGKPYTSKGKERKSENYRCLRTVDVNNDGTRYPTSILSGYPRRTYKAGHPQQKPLDLLIYLIKTYTRPGDLILDPTCGSGTTLEAASRLGRRAIGIEAEKRFIEMGINRLTAINN